MATETVLVAEGRVDALLPGLVVVAFVAEPGATILDLAIAVIELMIAVGKLVARIAAVPLQSTVKTRAACLARVTMIAGLATEGIDRPWGRGGSAVTGARQDDADDNDDGEK